MKIIALTGEPCSGKSSSLYHFGKLGARFLNFDHILATITDARNYKNFSEAWKDYKSAYNEALEFSKIKIDEFRKSGSNAILVFEANQWVVQSLEKHFDAIVKIQADEKIRVDRQMARTGKSKAEALISLIRIGDKSLKGDAPVFIIDNNGGISELKQKVRKTWRKIAYLR